MVRGSTTYKILIWTVLRERSVHSTVEPLSFLSEGEAGAGTVLLVHTDPNRLLGSIETELMSGTNKNDDPSLSRKDPDIACFVRLQLVVEVP
jgi:hypothetical protein